MAQALERLLDRWEPRLTRPPKRWRGKTPPRWVLWGDPSLALTPDRPYSWRLLLRQTLLPVALILLFVLVPAALALAFYGDPGHWRQALLHHGPAHARLMGLLAKLEGPLTCELLLLALLNFASRLPRFLCWNRRAARLRRGPAPAPAAPAAPDPTVWPPAPRKLS